MKLVLKRPKEKPPCICLLFEDVYQASSLNKFFVETHKNIEVDLLVQIQDNQLNLLFSLPIHNYKFRYDNVEYIPEELFRFLYDTKDAPKFNFCHINVVKGKHQVASTTNNCDKWVLKVNSVKLDKEY